MWCSFFGGPEEIRTPDPYNANVMRSQLRYRPMGYFWIIQLEKRFVKEKEDTAACPLCAYLLFFFAS